MLKEIIDGKNILFITTKNIDYIRNTQELRILKENGGSVKEIYSLKKKNIFRMIDVWFKLLTMNISDIDVVFIGFAPQLILPFWGWRFKKKVIVIDFFVSVYDTYVNDRKKFKENGFVAKLSRRLDESTIRKANHIIVDTNADGKYFEREFGEGKKDYETLYLEADESVYYPRKANKNKSNNKFVVLYFGSILPLQGVDIVLGAVQRLRDNEDIFFDIIGPISDKYCKPIQKNVCYTGWLSQEELAEHIANADLCLAGHFNRDIDKAHRTIPGKAYIYEKMKKKMVLGDSVANHELFTEDERHKFVSMGNSEFLAKKILECRCENNM